MSLGPWHRFLLFFFFYLTLVDSTSGDVPLRKSLDGNKVPGSGRSVLGSSPGTADKFITLGKDATTAYRASNWCNDRVGSTGPSVLVPAAYALQVLQEVSQDVLDGLEDYMKNGADTDCMDKGSIWVLDPRGGCRAASLVFNNEDRVTSIIIDQVPCSCQLKYICISYRALKTLAEQDFVPYNSFWVPDAPSVPQFQPPTRLQSGMRLAAQLPPGDLPSQLYSGAMEYDPSGGNGGAVFPVANLVGSWTEAGMSALKALHMNSSQPSKRRKARNSTAPTADAWNPDDVRSDSALAAKLSYIVRVEGCASATAIQRLVVTKASGATYAQGVGHCTANFAEAAPVGGYLAYANFTQVNLSNDMSRVVRLQFIWAVPALPGNKKPSMAPGDDPSPPLYQVFPRTQPAVPVPSCSEAHALAPATGPLGRDQCGESSYACPSYMCCALRNDGARVCDIAEKSCQASTSQNGTCSSALGLCGDVPWDHHYISAYEGFPSYDAPYFNSSIAVREPLDTAPVRNGTVLYAMDRTSGNVSYDDAWRSCSGLDSLGLSWELINATDAMAFELSVLLGRDFQRALSGLGPAWLRRSAAEYATGCMTAAWEVDQAQVELVSLQMVSCSARTARIICRARWPGPWGMQLANGTATAANTVFLPGAPHNLTMAEVGDGIALSGPGCRGRSLETLALDGRASRYDPVLDSTVFRDPVEVQLLPGAFAMRPLVTWSAVTEPPRAYEAVSSLAVQYYTRATGAAGASAMLPVQSVVLGPENGSALGNGSSPGPLPPLGASLREADGWRSLQLDVGGGERVVEVAGCRGGLLEALVLRTSAGRLWSAPAGPGFGCSVPFRRTAPQPGAFLLGLQAVAGSYVEELELIWATPVPPPPPLPPPMPPAPAAAIAGPDVAPTGVASNLNRSGNTKDDGSGGSGGGEVSALIKPSRPFPQPSPSAQTTEIIFEAGSASTDIGVGVGAGVGGTLLLVALAAGVWKCCRRRRWRSRYGAAAAGARDTSSSLARSRSRSRVAAADTPSDAPSDDGSSRGGVELADVVVGRDDVRRAEESAGPGVKKVAMSPSLNDSTESGGGTTTTTTTYSGSIPPLPPLPVSINMPDMQMQMAMGMPQLHLGSQPNLHPDRAFGTGGNMAAGPAGVYGGGVNLYVAQLSGGGRGEGYGNNGKLAVVSAANGGGGVGDVELQTHAALFHRALYAVGQPASASTQDGPGGSAVLSQAASGASSLAPLLGTTMTGLTGTGSGTGTGSTSTLPPAKLPQTQLGESASPGSRDDGDGKSLRLSPQPPPLRMLQEGAEGGGRGVGAEAAEAEAVAVTAVPGVLPPDQRMQLTTHESPQHAAQELLLGRDVTVDVDDPATYLGHGTSGVVRRGLLRQPDGSWRTVAVKLLNSPPGEQATDAYNRHLRTLVQEVTILGSLRHPNIVQLLGGSLQPGASFIVEEMCGRTLSHAIYDGTTPYSLELVLRWSTDIARGLAFLHPNIMHRDLKPSNVLLDESGTAKISDFGLARFKAHTTLHTRDAEVGTTCYMAPECFVSADVKVTAACDVYSLGVLMNEMAARCRPWSGVRTAVVGFKVAVVGERPDLPPEDSPLCPQGLRQLIRDCWAQKPEDRPGSIEVLARLTALLEKEVIAAAPPAATAAAAAGSSAAAGRPTGPAPTAATSRGAPHKAEAGGAAEAPGTLVLAAAATVRSSGALAASASPSAAAAASGGGPTAAETVPGPGSGRRLGTGAADAEPGPRLGPPEFAAIARQRPNEADDAREAGKRRE